jgi:hypothetical protein
MVEMALIEIDGLPMLINQMVMVFGDIMVLFVT